MRTTASSSHADGGGGARRSWRTETLLVPVRNALVGTTGATGDEEGADARLAMHVTYRGTGEQDTLGAAATKGGVAALLLHPHPALGGSSNNNVVHAMRTALTGLSASSRGAPIACVAALNFRGVGGSSGSVALRGTRDSNDVAQVVQYLVSSSSVSSLCGPISKIVIIGYSWGSAVGAGALAPETARESIAGFVAVSPPLSRLANVSLGSLALWSTLEQRRDSCPLLVLHGSRDAFASVADVRKHLEAVRTHADARLEVHESADHFWSGNEPWLVERVHEWLTGMQF